MQERDSADPLVPTELPQVPSFLASQLIGVGSQKPVVAKGCLWGPGKTPEAVGASEDHRVIADAVIQLSADRESIVQTGQAGPNLLKLVTDQVAGGHKGVGGCALNQQIQCQTLVDLLNQLGLRCVAIG